MKALMPHFGQRTKLAVKGYLCSGRILYDEPQFKVVIHPRGMHSERAGNLGSTRDGEQGLNNA